MNKLNKMKIYILDISQQMTNAFKETFKCYDNVKVVNDDLYNFYQGHKEEIDCLVSPANAYGYMTGGYDAVLSDILGWDFQEKVQNYIKNHYFGEQLVGTSFIIDTDINNLKLIHTPTMQRPSIIKDDFIVYQCMRSTLMCALKHNVKCIVIPVFGGSCGGINPNVAAKRMKDGYEQILSKKGADYQF